MGKVYEKANYCQCQECASVTTEDVGIGCWLICCKCNKRIEDTFEYYNHYDGEDHMTDFY